MPKGYWIVRVDITDQEKYKTYVAANAQTLGKVWRALSCASRSLRKSRRRQVVFAMR